MFHESIKLYLWSWEILDLLKYFVWRSFYMIIQYNNLMGIKIFIQTFQCFHLDPPAAGLEERPRFELVLWSQTISTGEWWKSNIFLLNKHNQIFIYFRRGILVTTILLTISTTISRITISRTSHKVWRIQCFQNARFSTFSFCKTKCKSHFLLSSVVNMFSF